MNIRFSLSLWSYAAYAADVPSLDRITPQIRAAGFRVEVWPNWSDERDLFNEVGRRRLIPLVAGMVVSMHGVATPRFLRIIRRESMPPPRSARKRSSSTTTFSPRIVPGPTRPWPGTWLPTPGTAA